MLACILVGEGSVQVPDAQFNLYAAFIQHAWNPDKGRFRNFMGFNRSWLEEEGSEDSHGRAIWALGECVRSDPNPSRRSWARALLPAGLAFVEQSGSIRTQAFALLGLDALTANSDLDKSEFDPLKRRLAERILAKLEKHRTEEWTWFEPTLAYDNARICQAIILTGISTGVANYTIAGMQTLRWLIGRQTAAAGHFRPLGSESFGRDYQHPEHFDQQPLEASATIAACIAAWTVVNDPFWLTTADLAFAWFHGKNDLSVSLVDEATGGCRDGLHPDRANENQGAESVLSYLLAVSDMRRVARLRDNAEKPVRPVGTEQQRQLRQQKLRVS